MKHIISFFILAVSFISIAYAHTAKMQPTRQSGMMGPPENAEVIVLNRPLAKIHEKVISVMDVKKKMDLFIKENHPDLANIPVACYQYYSQNWRSVLQEMIHNELMIQEAEAIKLKISDGDVKEELMRRFGPNIFARFDELNLNYDSAKALVKADITVRNLGWFRVWGSVFQKVTPGLVKLSYDEFLLENKPKDMLTYQMVTLHNEEKTTPETVLNQIAKDAHKMLRRDEVNVLEETIATVQEKLPTTASFNISKEYCVNADKLSEKHRMILADLPAKTFSEPQKEVNKKDNMPIYRMFYMKDREKIDPPPLSEVFNKLQNELYQENGDQMQAAYYERLRKNYCCEHLVVANMFPEDYQPFLLSTK